MLPVAAAAAAAAAAVAAVGPLALPAPPKPGGICTDVGAVVVAADVGDAAATAIERIE